MTSIKSDLSCQKTKAEFSREMNISSVVFKDGGIQGSNFLFGDGSIHFIQSSIHPEQFISLFTPIGGDIATIP